jgi:transcriptional regulator with XRE-family HTH domain
MKIFLVFLFFSKNYLIYFQLYGTVHSCNKRGGASVILARNIRYLRKKQGMSQEELAERLGYKSYTTIQKWESGVSEPPLKTAHEIAHIFDVDIDDLVKVELEYKEETRAETYQRIMKEEAAAQWYNSLNEEQKRLINLLAYLPSDKVDSLLNFAESWMPPQTQETD